MEPSVSNPEGLASVKVGDEVWVKPPDANCTTRWKKGFVTGINSANNVSVDGMPRHILDLRRVVVPDKAVNDDEALQNDAEFGTQMQEDPTVEEVANEVLNSDPAIPPRARRPPRWLADYETGEIDL